jgi:hypothetical protein
LYAAEENLGMRFFVNEDDEDEIEDGDTEASKSELIYAKIWDGIGA